MPVFKPTTIHAQQHPRGEAHSMDAEAFDEAIRSQGVTLVHYRAMVCPQGMVDKDNTNRRFHEDHAGCSNGYLYKKAGLLTALFTGNASGPSHTDLGAIDGSTVQVTFPRQYDDTQAPVYILPYDRFFLADETIFWPEWEIIEHNLTGIDKLRYPALSVDHVIDNRLVEYGQGKDFEVRDGKIVWLKDGARPGIDADAGPENRGRVCTVWYLYRPYWYCQRLGHEGRFIQTEGNDGIRRVTRMPFQATLVREHIFESQVNADNPESQEPREQRAPRDGSNGPR